MKNIFITILFVVVLFTASCVPAQVSDQELQTSLNDLSDEDLDTVIAEADKSEAPLAGQAILSKVIPPGIKARVSNDQLLANAQAIKIKRLEKKIADLTAGQGGPIVVLPQKTVEGSPPDDGMPGTAVAGNPPDDSVPSEIKEVEGVPPIQ